MIPYYNGTVSVGEESLICSTYYDHVVLKEHIWNNWDSQFVLENWVFASKARINKNLKRPVGAMCKWVHRAWEIFPSDFFLSSIFEMCCWILCHLYKATIKVNMPKFSRRRCQRLWLCVIADLLLSAPPRFQTTSCLISRLPVRCGAAVTLDEAKSLSQ